MTADTDKPLCKLTAPPMANAAEAAGATARAPLATLLMGEVIQQGEIVQLVIKPSRWFIIFNSLLFSGAVVLLVLAAQLLHWGFLGNLAANIQLAIVLIAGRLMWSGMQWMGRYYILTDMRVIRLSGVFDVEIASIPLRRVSGLKMYRFMSERMLGKGTIEITAADHPTIFWHAISRPAEIHERVLAAVNKSQQSGHCHP